MKEEIIFKKLASQAPVDYTINEIIPISYPFMEVRINALVNRSPEDNLLNIYHIILSAIKNGLKTTNDLFAFLGLSANDEFMLQELYSLQNKGYVGFFNAAWCLSNEGEKFLNNHSIMREEANEDFTFLIDGVSGECVGCDSVTIKKMTGEDNYTIDKQIKFSERDAALLKNKFTEIAAVYKNSHKNAYLIDYDGDIQYAETKYARLWLVEYKTKDNVSSIEIREDNEKLTLQRRLTKLFNGQLRTYLYDLSTSDRKNFGELNPYYQQDWVTKDTDENVQIETKATEIRSLSIWETKQKFIDALQSAKSKILIESPWIKRATREYIPYFERFLGKGGQLVILYGIDDESEHDSKTMKQLEQLQSQYPKRFLLVDLPSHLETTRSKLTGSHRKILIKDDDFFISGSFNFLSNAVNPSDNRIANEESTLVRSCVEAKKRWKNILAEYYITDFITS